MTLKWKDLFSQYIKDSSVQGSELKGRCCFHDDQDPSFTANLETGQFICYGCNEKGNVSTFLQKLNVPEDQIRKILGAHGEKKERPAYTVEDYAREKCLSMDLLRDLRIVNRKPGISIPYLDEHGQTVTTRARFSPDGKGPKFAWKAGAKTMLYGLWLIEKIRREGYVILVEGESDSHTLWQHDYPALGVPGASTFKREWLKHLYGLQVFIYSEKDQGSKVLQQKIAQAALDDPDWKGSFKVMSLPDFKDPSELHCALARGQVEDRVLGDFHEIFDGAMADAAPVDVKQEAKKGAGIMVDAPGPSLRIPDGWHVSADGVFQVDPKSGILERVTHTPITIRRALTAVETGIEKVELSLRLQKEWKDLTFDRTTIYQSSKLPVLAEHGAGVTSENARALVRYLSALEGQNYDRIERGRCASQCGWHGQDFLPFNQDNGLVMHLPDPATRRWIAGYQESGNLQDWAAAIDPYRKNELFRFIMAGAFAAPLLRILDHRIFIIHHYGNTRIGKTAALKAALSVYGSPDNLLVNFNATKVALERIAALFRDLPLGIDEKQASNKQEFIEGLMYMLALGSGRARGSKHGGLQEQATWQSVIMTTGEEPSSVDETKSGIYSRVLEVTGQAFESEAAARPLHNLKHYGSAGPVYIEEIKKRDPDQLRDRYEQFLKFLEQQANESRLQTHLSAIAVCMLGDMIASQVLFGMDESEAVVSALDVGIAVWDLTPEKSDTDITYRVQEDFQSWLSSERGEFTHNHRRANRLGFLQDDYFYIFPGALKDFLKSRGYHAKGEIDRLIKSGVILQHIGPQSQIDRGERTRTIKIEDADGEDRVVRVYVVKDPEVDRDQDPGQDRDQDRDRDPNGRYWND